jgi:hypothetical protein
LASSIAVAAPTPVAEPVTMATFRSCADILWFPSFMTVRPAVSPLRVPAGGRIIPVRVVNAALNPVCYLCLPRIGAKNE